MLGTKHPELPSGSGQSVPFLSHWHVREVTRDESTLYEVRDSRGAVIAADIKCVEHARLFALSPLIFQNFQLLEEEAIRGLWHMIDVNPGSYDVEEVAADVDGEFERTSPGTPDHAQWLMEVASLREVVGEQNFPPAGTPRQVDLFTA